MLQTGVYCISMRMLCIFVSYPIRFLVWFIPGIGSLSLYRTQNAHNNNMKKGCQWWPCFGFDHVATVCVCVYVLQRDFKCSRQCIHWMVHGLEFVAAFSIFRLQNAIQLGCNKIFLKLLWPHFYWVWENRACSYFERIPMASRLRPEIRQIIILHNKHDF